MFAAFKSYDSGATEYSMLYYPKKHSRWLIVFFFHDSNKLTESLKNGLCFQIHHYLIKEFQGHYETSAIETTFLFEPGKRPLEKHEADDLFALLINKLQGNTNASYGDNKTCGCCGHDFDNHQLLCNRDIEDIAPTEGWIICPEENCNCFQTWSANYKPDEVKEQQKPKGIGSRLLGLFKRNTINTHDEQTPPAKTQ